MAIKKPLVIDFATGGWEQLQAGDYIGIEQGGTGAGNPGDARIALGLEIGVDIQAYNAELSGLTTINTLGALFRTGVGTYTSRTFVQPSKGITITNADGVDGNPTLALANDLAALEGLAGTGFAVRTANETWVQRTFSTASVARLTVVNPDGVDGDVTYDLAQVADNGLGSFRKFTRDNYGRVSGTTPVVTNDLTPLLDNEYVRKDGAVMTGALILSQDATQDMGAVTLRQLSAYSEGRRDKKSVELLSTVNVNIANPGTSTFDNTAANIGDRILLVGQNSHAENGPWVFNGAGVAMTRPADFNSDDEVVNGATFFVDLGDQYKDSNWTLISSGPYTLGTTPLEFSKTSGLGQVSTGNGLTKDGNLISVVTAARLTFTTGAIDLAPSGVVAGTGYTKMDIDQYGRAIAAGHAVPSDIGAQPHSPELDGVSGLTANGLVARTTTGTYAARIMVAPAAGITIANPDGVSGNITVALANDLDALESLSGTGIAVRTGVDTWAQRTITSGGAARISVTNGNGVAGNPVVDLVATGVQAGTYYGMSYDQYGRLINANPIINFNTPGSTMLNNEASQSVIGMVVYTDGAASFKRAVANADGTSKPIGVLFQTIASAQSGVVATSGPVTATTAQWDAVTGQTGGLTPGATYFLDNVTAGHLTSTAPTTGYLVAVGEATSSVELVVRVGQRYKL